MRDETLARDLVLDVFGTFLDSYRLHFELEEENFFPEAARLLNDADWARVAQTLAYRPNPLLIYAGDGRFVTLRHSILHMPVFRRLSDSEVAPSQDWLAPIVQLNNKRLWRKP